MAMPQKTYESIPRRDKSEACPLSFPQERIWFLNQLEPDSPAYNQPKAVRLSGALDIRALKKALDALVERHEILRTQFLSPNGSPVQVVGPVQSIDLPWIDLSALAAEEREARLERCLLQVTDQIFDLSRHLMLRAALFRMAPTEHVLLLVTHHIASDGWSTGILFREIAALYEAFSAGTPAPLADLAIQYADYAVWQRRRPQGEALEKLLLYWKKKLAGISPLELPTDRPRPAVRSSRGARQFFILPMSLCNRLKLLSRQQGVTLFMTLLATFQTLLYRYTGQEDIAVGSPIAGRTRSEIEGLIGFFVKTLVLRSDLSGNPTFRELLDRVRKVALAGYEHQDLPFEKLVEELHPDRDLSRSPLFHVMFAHQNVPRQTRELPGLTVSPVEINNETAKFDLSLFTLDEKEGLKGRIEYSTDLFDGTTIKRMIGHFQTLLEGVVANPDQQLSDLPILTEAEHHQLLVEWNDTKRDYPKDTCVHELFQAQVERTPDSVAVMFEERGLTYRELNRRANQLAHYLTKLGVGAEVLVGICIERSPEMVIAMLGILKAGGAYVPLDPEYPRERLAFMMGDTQISVLLTQQRWADRLPTSGAQVVCMDTDREIIGYDNENSPACHAKPGNLAYVIYTSGSTGTPKGVQVAHRSIAHSTQARIEYYTEPPKNYLLLSSFAFDSSLAGIFWALCQGGTLVLPQNRDEQDPIRIAKIIADNHVSHLLCLPSFYALLLHEADPQQLILLYTVIVAGEPCPVDLVDRHYQLLSRTALFNEYGPTECTVWSSVYNCEGHRFRDKVPIGRPIANAQIYLLDQHLNPVPIGVTGELYVGGVGLARGYLKRPELTAERFIPNPFSEGPGARLYRTGDLARYLLDGDIEFLGRIDNQVKIRGFRIELGEIESVLVQHAAVQQVVARARDDGTGDKRLIAYVVLEQERTATTNELREFLKEQLPDYMVPSLFVFVDSLPLTPNGKIDHRALPAPNGEGHRSDTEYVAPVNPLESQLVEIWEEFLPVHPIGTRDNFFHIGGHSLLAARLMQRIQEVSGKKLPLSVLFTEPTIEQLAQTIVNRHVGECPSLLTQIQPGGDKIPFFFLHGDIHGGGLYCLNLARALGTERPFYALAPQTPNGKLVRNSIEAIAECYIKLMRAAQPEGPYLLGGYCNGGFVVYEMARQLKRQGEKVEQVLLIAANARNGPRMRFLQRLVFGLGYLRGLGSEETMELFLKLRNLYIYYTGRMRDVAQWALCKQIAWAFRQVKRVVWEMARMVAPAGFSRGNLSPTDGEASQTKAADNDPLRSYSRAMNSYVTRSYSGQVVLFWPIEEPTRNPEDPSMGWGGAVRNIEVRRVPGDHTTCIRDHVRTLADQMKVCLDKVRVDGTTGDG